VKVETQGIKDANENKVLVCSEVKHLKTFKTLSYVFAVLEIILMIVLVVYIFASRNTDINYTIKVKKIMNGYKSFIQRILNKFNFEGFQILYLETIEELLDIRDTLQMPVLMYENDDKTCAQFMLPTTNNVLYMYELKVDNYDELYSDKVEEVIEENVVATQEELVVVEENVTSEVNEEPNTLEIIRYNYSFEARIILAKDEYKRFYQDIIKYAKEYGVNVVRSWDRERVYLGRKLFASLQFRGKTLYVAFPINPNDEAYKKYNFMDFSDKKRYQQYPAVIKITSRRKVKYVTEILERLFKESNIENKNLTYKETTIKTKSKNSLIKAGLIKTN
jgi:hypothetical protein